MRTLRRISTLMAAALMVSTGASGYYFFVHFATRTAPYNVMPEKFDVNALRNKTVYYFISDAGPAVSAPSDSFASFVSELRLAAKVWNDVSSSDLRLAFGGLASTGTPQNTPGIDIIFSDDMPPGVVALSGPTTVSGFTNGSFLPITRSTLQLHRDLHDFPSFSELNFTTLVHEFGHTLGLQHTLTSATMSTSLTRATTRSAPLAADDIAAISVLYPAGSFLANTGSISGRVTMSGAGVNLASVVAIAANGPAVSSLTNPDGTYTIQGIPAGQAYALYVHPLPLGAYGESRPADIVPPKDPDGNSLPSPVASGTAFDTVFFPGTKDPNAATPFYIGSGDNRTGVNFAVNRRAAAAFSSVTTYGFSGSNAVHPAPILGTGSGSAVTATGTGLLGSNGASLAQGLTVSVLGQSGANLVGGSLQYYTQSYISFYLAPTFGSNYGPRHLIFAANNDIYILPAGVLLVGGPPPAVTGVNSAVDDRGNRAVQIAGSGFDGTTRVLFDGAQASIIRQNADGSLLVAPPAATSGYRANVVALNGDGQSSLFVQNSAPAYQYDSGDPVSIATITPSALPAGSEAMVAITGSGFVEGQTVVGFGSSDITIRRLWITDSNHILANVSVAPAATAVATEFTVASGLQIISQPFAFQVLPASARQVVMIPPIVNSATGALGVPSGAIAGMQVLNLNVGPGSIALTVNDQRANVLTASSGQVTFVVPAGLALGPAVVKMQVLNGDPVFPVLMNVDPQPPAITGVFSSQGVAADAGHPALRGQLTGFLVTGLPELSTIPDIGAIHVMVGGVDHAAASATAQNGGVLVQALLSVTVSAGVQVPATVSYNGAVSAQVFFPVR